VSVRELVFGKVMLRFVAFLAVVGVLGLVALFIGRIDLSASGVVPRLTLWTAAVVLYGLFWFAAAVAVTALGRPSATNAMILAGVWLALVVLVPSLLNVAATTAYPVPSRVEMIQATRVASDDANADGSKLLARYYEDHPELAAGDAQEAMNDFNLVRVAANAEVERRVRPVLGRFARQLSEQQRIIGLARFLSPAILVQDAVNDVAGTGGARHREFVRPVETYHEAWRGYFVRLVFQKAQLDDYSGVPRFTFEEETSATVARRVAASLTGLALPALVIGCVAFVRLSRYPVVG
jgi:ABC-2 type transport system permease protein